MPFISETSHIPIPPPGEDELPCDDGEPMESERHREQMILLIDTLKSAWRDRDDVYVSGNMAIYFSELQAKKNDFRGPDVFVVLDAVRRERKSWVVWQEDGKTPDVVIELLSASTEKVDRGDKMRIYAKLLRVPEYYLFDPLTSALEAYALDRATQSYERLAPGPNGDYASARLRLRLGVRRSVHHGIEADWLRWIDEEGRELPTGEEEARAAEEEARAAEREARAAEREARAAKEEAGRLAARLAEYEKRFGPLPGRSE